jgi:hypothetical protein
MTQLTLHCLQVLRGGCPLTDSHKPSCSAAKPNSP